jgi:hypothetical protein
MVPHRQEGDVSIESNETQLVVEATDRHALVLALVDKLRALLGDTAAWEDGATVVPWQASAEAFERLPEQVLASLVDAWGSHCGRCVDLELSGYLETDTGPRAWGTVTMLGALSAEGHPVRADSATVTTSGGSYRLVVSLHIPRGGDA